MLQYAISRTLSKEQLKNMKDTEEPETPASPDLPLTIRRNDAGMDRHVSLSHYRPDLIDYKSSKPLLEGNLKEMTRITSRCVKIFLSSTFTGLYLLSFVKRLKKRSIFMQILSKKGML